MKPITAAVRSRLAKRSGLAAGGHWPRPLLMPGILPLPSGRVSVELAAGLTLAALAIPEVIGYARIAGMPLVTGLYTILVPMAVFAVLGSSRHLVVGADSATAAIMASGLAGLAAAGSRDYVAYAGLLAFLTATLLILARLVRLGFLADFLSHTVLIGFLTGVGVQLLLGQIPGILGIPVGGGDIAHRLLFAIERLGQASPYSVGIALAAMAIVVGGRRLSPRIPGALLAVIAAIVVSYGLGLSVRGVNVVGSVASGAPSFGLPAIRPTWTIVGRLMPTALSMMMVILAQSAATSRAYAVRYGEHLSEETDLVGLGLANAGAALTGAFVVNGSPTKTQMVDGAGGRSQLAQLAASAVVLAVLFFLTRPLAYLPDAVVASIVFLIGVELIDLPGMRRILAERPYEFWVALATAMIVVFAGVEQGILLAILLSLIIHTRHGYKPRNSLLTIDENGDVRVAAMASRAQAEPGLMIYRFNHSMYYANAEDLAEEVRDLAATASPPLVWFCIDAVAVDDVDYTAAETLRELQAMLEAKGIRLVVVNLQDDVMAELERSRLTGALGPDATFQTVGEVIRSYRADRLARSGTSGRRPSR